MATGWIVIAVLVAGVPDTPPGGSGFPTFFELLPAGLAALGATLYVAIAATAVLVIIVPVIIVPVSAGPVRQEPTRGLAQATFTLFVGEVTAFIATAVAKMGGNLAVVVECGPGLLKEPLEALVGPGNGSAGQGIAVRVEGADPDAPPEEGVCLGEFAGGY